MQKPTQTHRHTQFFVSGPKVRSCEVKNLWRACVCVYVCVPEKEGALVGKEGAVGYDRGVTC